MPTGAELRQAWESLPCIDPTSLQPARRPLILAPPDDESLGCGGFIATCCAFRHPPVIVVLTDGGASHPELDDAARALLRDQRAQEVREAAAHLGVPPEHLVLFCRTAS